MMMTAACIPALLGAAGLGLDVVQWYVWKRQLQNVADTAALSGAYAKAQGDTGWRATAISDFGRNDDIAPTGFAVGVPTTGPNAGNASSVEAVLTYERKLPFSGIFLASATTVRVSSEATVLANGKYCLISLGTGIMTGISATTGSANLGCGAATNASGPNAAQVASSFIASPVSAVGAVQGMPGGVNPKVFSYSVKQADPFADLPDVVVPSPCSPRIQVMNAAQSTSISGTTCHNGMKLTGGTLTLDGGTHYFKGDLEINGNASLVANNAVIILGPNANISISGTPNLQLTAPTSGDYEGVMIYQSRSATASTGVNDNKITGDSSSFFQGAVYMKNQAVEFTGNSGMNTNCLQVVANQITVSGSTNINNSCPLGSGADAFDGLVVKITG